MKAFDVRPDGSLGPVRMLRAGIGAGTMSEGNLDGMECDEHGNIWTSGPGGVWGAEPPTASGSARTRTPEICGSVAVRWAGPHDAVPHHHDHGAPAADEGALRTPARPRIRTT